MSVSAGGSPVHDALPLILVQLLFIITLSRIYAWILRPLKQPSVIAEVLAGITLGPTLFGRIPTYLTIFFPPASLPTLSVVANIGLIFFLYFVGLELDTSLLRKNIKQGFAISISAIIAPFLLGIGVAYLLYSVIATTDNLVAFLLFIGVAMSITAFPVLARILTEFNLLNERVGVIAISAAAVDDVVAWCLLALVVSIARATDPLEALYTLILLLAFFLFMITVVKRLLHTIAKEVLKDESYSFSFIVFLIIMIFLCAWTTEVIGVHAIFGAFILGVVTPRSFSLRVTERLEDLVLVVFLPAFFAYSGLRTDLGLLNSALVWGLSILVICAACAGKFGASTLVARCLGNGWRESCCVGILLNTKGLVELIVLNIGLDVGVLNSQVFAIFVLMAIVTTIMTSPLVYYFWIRYHKRRKEKKKSPENSILVCPTTPASGRRMVTLAAIFNIGQLNQKNRLRALYLFNLSDRPSSYAVTSRIANAERQAPYNIVKQRARELRVQLKTKMMITSHAVRDICNYAEEHQSNFCFFEWDWNNQWDEEYGRLDRLPDGHFPHAEAVQRLINTPAVYDRTVGLIVDKGIDKVGEITRILIPVWPSDNVELLCSVNPSVNVNVLTDPEKLPAETQQRLAHIAKSHSNITVSVRTPTAESINSVADEQGVQVIVMLSHGPRRPDAHASHVVDGLVRTDSEAGVLLQTTNTSVVLLGFSDIGDESEGEQRKTAAGEGEGSIMRMEDGV